MTEILIATGNAGKVREYGVLFADLPVTLLSLKDVGIDGMDVVEDGTTFVENAAIKARAYAQASGKITLADDSGLCVDALDGAPGIYSARFGGPGLDDAGRRQHLLKTLDGVPDDQRGAHFACVIVVIDPATDAQITAEGQCNGTIRHQDSDGEHGFGYDALFQPDGLDVTFAQIDKATKNRISHRGHAVQNLLPDFEKLLASR